MPDPMPWSRLAWYLLEMYGLASGVFVLVWIAISLLAKRKEHRS